MTITCACARPLNPFRSQPLIFVTAPTTYLSLNPSAVYAPVATVVERLYFLHAPEVSESFNVLIMYIPVNIFVSLVINQHAVLSKEWVLDESQRTSWDDLGLPLPNYDAERSDEEKQKKRSPYYRFIGNFN